VPALNFQARFARMVEVGLLQDAGKLIGGPAKRQTIRAYRKDGRDPKPGDTLYLFTGMRTKACRKLGAVVCAQRYEIVIWNEPGAGVIVALDGALLPGIAADSMAHADGFEDAAEMGDWFEQTHGLPFMGLLIRWGPQR